jgi:hypothetical protein
MCNDPARQKKMLKAYKCEITESVLLKWIRQKQALYIPIQCLMFSQKAEETTLKLNAEFTSSNGGKYCCF